MTGEQALLGETEYRDLAYPELERLMAALDELADDVDVELAGDVLTLEFEDGARFVVNTQRPARQIWLAADRSAWHFDFERSGSRWIESKTQAELWSTLQELLTKRLKRSVVLQPPA